MTSSVAAGHRALLSAALNEPGEAEQAWVRWRASNTTADPDSEEGKILSIVASRLPAVLDDPELGRLRGLRRNVAATTLLRAAKAIGAQNALRERGIDNVFFKGIAMVPQYGRASIRSMRDADLLVPHALRHEALEVLADLGYHPEMFSLTLAHRWIDRPFAPPGIEMRHPDGSVIDLHRRPLHDLSPTSLAGDSMLFAAARCVTMNELSLTVPHPSHHVVLTIGHGVRHESLANLMGLVDAAQLLAAVDHDPRLTIELAVAFDRVAQLGDGLQRLRSVFTTPCDELAAVPERITELLAALPPPSAIDRLAHRARTGSRASNVDQAVRHLDASVRATTGNPVRAGGRAGAAANLLRHSWHVSRIRHLPVHTLWVMSGRRAGWSRFRRTASPGTAAELSPATPVALIGPTLCVDAIGVGWTNPTAYQLWSQGRESTLWVRISPEHRHGAVLWCTVEPLVHRLRPTLNVDVLVDGRRRARWRFHASRPGQRRIPLLVDETDGDESGTIELTFVIRSPRAPNRLEPASTDFRPLGISVSELCLSVGPD